MVYELQFKGSTSRTNSPLSVRKVEKRDKSPARKQTVSLAKEDEENRGVKINYFLKQILSSQKTIYNYKSESQTSLHSLDALINEQFRQLDVFSQQLIEFVSSFKSKYQQTLLEEQKALETKNQAFYQNLDTYNQQLQSIKTDIEDNYANIIHNIGEQPFRHILDVFP